MRKDQRKGRQYKRAVINQNRDWTLGLQVMHSKAAGIDVGNEEHFVAVPPQLDAEPVRVFGCFTGELKRMADWLTALGITTVAMQSTGVYWIPPYDILAERGIQVFLVNARDTKNLPGRKTDIQECQWLLKLHVYGLLKNSFRPDEEICVMRAYWRQRQQHIGSASTCLQRMQKALTQMNLQLSNVVSDISGATGTAIVRAILAGERDPWKLAELRDRRLKASKAVIAASLEGNWREELLFILKQEFESYQMYQRKIAQCDEKLSEQFQRMQSLADPQELPPCPRNKKPRSNDNVPAHFDLRQELYRVTGVDLTRIDGINVLTAQTMLAEVGHDMSRWETEQQFVSWLGTAPRNKVSGGKLIGRDRRKVVNRAGQALRMAATTLLNSQTYLGAQYRRFRSKLGAPKAIKAMANKLARLVYRLLKHGTEYIDKGTDFYERKYRDQQIRFLTKKADQLGMQLVHSAGTPQ